MSAPDINDLLSRSGHLLWRELPEEYRYRDAGPLPGEPGDLAMYLHGMGHLLDLIRGTTEQLYADSFAETVDDGAGGRQIQSWLLPYLGELVGADLTAPDPRQRVEELNASVRWYKSKGTLASVDEVGDVVTGAETVAREGWRGLLTCPRVGLPPFSLPPQTTAADKAADGRPRVATGDDPTGGGLRPLGTPDFRLMDRAVKDPAGSNPLYRITQPHRSADGVEDAPVATYWRPLAPGGIPCFPGSYADHAPRTPDLRDPATVDFPGPHPRRTLIHVRPPDGVFAAGLKVVTLGPGKLTPPAAGVLRITPREVLALAGQPNAPVPDRIVVKLTGDLHIGTGRQLEMEGVLLIGTVQRQVGGVATQTPVRLIAAPQARLILDRCAAERVVLEGEGPEVAGRATPSLDARDCLFGAIAGGTGFARLEYCTVTAATDVTVLQASDCLLGALSSNLNCTTDPPAGQAASCLRYSRAKPADAAACTAWTGGTNTARRPRFARRWICTEGAPARFEVPGYGEPGYGVLSTLCPSVIAKGAEDEGEMGAHHHLFLSAELAALARKLITFLPVGQEIAIFHDPLLALTPPALTA